LENLEVDRLSGWKFYRSWKFWVTVIILALAAIVMMSNWTLMIAAWGIFLSAKDSGIFWWIIGLIFVVQLVSYLLRGDITYLYLKSKGENVTRLEMARRSLEVNFVDHFAVFSAFVGMAYFVPVMAKRGVDEAKSMIAQLILYQMTLIITAMYIIVSVIYLMMRSNVPIGVVITCCLVVFITACLVAGIIYIIVDQDKITRMSLWVARVVNDISSWLTRGEKAEVLPLEKIEGFFENLRKEYYELIKDRKVLSQAFFLMFIVVFLDGALIWLFFASLGYIVDPAVIFIAFAVAGIASTLMVTPGGVGAYEPVMIAFIVAVGGIPIEAAVSGTIFARICLLLITFVFGFVFFEHTIITLDMPSKLRLDKLFERLK
jgi:uncharacterized protein (TIRG00374 family)